MNGSEPTSFQRTKPSGSIKNVPCSAIRSKSSYAWYDWKTFKSGSASIRNGNGPGL